MKKHIGSDMDQVLRQEEDIKRSNRMQHIAVHMSETEETQTRRGPWNRRTMRTNKRKKNRRIKHIKDSNFRRRGGGVAGFVCFCLFWGLRPCEGGGSCDGVTLGTV